MKQRVDLFFNKKLNDHRSEAPASAWDRIEATLDHQKRPFPWVRIAASVLILMIAGYILYSQYTRPVAQIAFVETHPTLKKEIPTAELEKEPVAEKPQEPIRHEALPKATVVVDRPAQKKTKTVDPPREETLAITSTLAVDITDTPAVLVAENTSDYPVTEIEIPVDLKPATKILISSEEANAKYLNEPFIADATSENKKSSKLRNLFEKAQELDPIGEIRQLKNEVLALNFRNEKKGERNR